MRVSELALQNIRRYEHVTITIPPGIVLISGDNGAGKTTLLEAMHLALVGTSFRPGATSAALIRHDADAATVDVDVIGDERELHIQSSLTRTGRSKKGRKPRHQGS